MARLTIRVEPTQNIIDATRKKNSPYTTNNKTEQLNNATIIIFRVPLPETSLFFGHSR